MKQPECETQIYAVDNILSGLPVSVYLPVIFSINCLHHKNEKNPKQPEAKTHEPSHYYITKNWIYISTVNKHLGFLVPFLTDTKLLLELLLQPHSLSDKTKTWDQTSRCDDFTACDQKRSDVLSSHLSFCLALFGSVCMLNCVMFLRSLSLRRFLCENKNILLPKS